MSNISTHVLDTSRGIGAPGIEVALERMDSPGRWSPVAAAKTDGEGRVRSLLPAGVALAAGTFRLRFATGAYYSGRGEECFFPHVDVAFTVTEASRHYHVPLLLSPYGYSTYRGT